MKDNSLGGFFWVVWMYFFGQLHCQGALPHCWSIYCVANL